MLSNDALEIYWEDYNKHVHPDLLPAYVIYHNTAADTNLFDPAEHRPIGIRRSLAEAYAFAAEYQSEHGIATVYSFSPEDQKNMIETTHFHQRLAEEWLRPSQDAPESVQELIRGQVMLDSPPTLAMDPEALTLAEDEDETEPQFNQSPLYSTDNDSEPVTIAQAFRTLASMLPFINNELKVNAYNALRVLASVLDEALPVTVTDHFAATNAKELAQFLSALDARYSALHEGQHLLAFGPTVWEPVEVFKCRLVDGTDFIAFGQPSRDPAATVL